MAVRNRYNDPNLGAAFENIASLFAPVSSSELAGYATADLTRQKAAAEAQRMGLVDMFVNGNGINDQAGIAAGLYTPNQSWGAVQMGDATARLGHSLDYRASRENNTADNARAMELGRLGDETNRRGQDLDFRALTENNVRDNQRHVQTTAIDSLLNPLGPGEQTREIGDDVWAAMGIPTMPTTPEYVNSTPSGSAKLTNVRLPDGTQTVAAQTDRGLVDPQSEQPLPPGTTMFSTAAQGSADEVGLGTAVRNRVDTQGMAAVSALDTIGQLEGLIRANPASQGVVGSLRGTAQNVMQSGNELGRFLGGAAAEAAEAASAGLIDAGIASEMFDPSIPAIDMLMNALAWQYAKGQAGDRVSNEQLRIARDAIGSSGMFNNQANSLTRLDQMRQMFMRDLDRYGPALSPEVQTMARSYWSPQGTAAPAAAPPPSAPAVPAVGTVEDGYRFLGGNPSDPASWEPVQ